MERQQQRSQRTSPTLHLLAIVFILGLAMLGYTAVIWSGDLHGYDPSKIVAARDLSFFIVIIGIFFWLTRKQKFRGEMIPLTAAVLLFAVGLLMQYRLFSDPEYGARTERSEIRRAKGQAIRLLNIKTGYDDDKKALLFGSPDAVPEDPPVLEKLPDREYTVGDILTSVNTYIPLIALFAMAGGFALFRSDKMLLWFQRHALIIGVATLVPFAVIAFLSESGKFLGQTTPWEGVKIFFLLSFAGLLADTYHHLRRTRWEPLTA
jgi:hypothetical protein